MNFFKPKDFRIPDSGIWAGEVGTTFVDENQAADIANAKLAVELGNEYSIVMFWKEKLEEERRENERLKATMKNAADELDSIEYDLYASVYTLSDDKFGTVFHVRDELYEALKEPKPASD